MDESILNSVKKALNIGEDLTAFDQDILMHINTAFSILNQIGIGPELGFRVEDALTQWSAFLGTDLRYAMAKTYVYLKVRSLFDPPQSSYHTTAMNESIDELLSRLSILRESENWTSPNPPAIFDGGVVIVLDGGTA